MCGRADFTQQDTDPVRRCPGETTDEKGPEGWGRCPDTFQVPRFPPLRILEHLSWRVSPFSVITASPGA